MTPDQRRASSRGTEAGRPLLATCFLAYSQVVQVQSRGPCAGTDPRAARAEEGCWAGGELRGAGTEQELLKAKGPVSYLSGSSPPLNRLEGLLQHRLRPYSQSL